MSLSGNITEMEAAEVEQRRKLLILGSDFGTVSVVRTAHEMGLYVITADLMDSSPTKDLSDEAWLVSTTDLDELERRCREKGVSAVMFGASDFNIGNARELCRRLGLPIYCADDYAWRVARDKGEFKRICRAVGAPVAEDYPLSDALSAEELDRIPLPAVVKPVDKSGNRGMSYCDTRQELIEGYRKARSVSDGQILVERRLRGKEYNVHYVLADGEARLLYFSSTHHEPGEAENLYSFKVTTSEHLRQWLDEVDEKAVYVLKRAGCREGIAWFDCIRDEDGHFYLLEMGHRFGGVMTYVPYRQVTGFDTVRWMLECALGQHHEEAGLPPALSTALSGCAASYNLFSRRSAEIGTIEGLEEIAAMPDVFIDMPKREGSSVREKACMGLLGLYGADAADLCRKLEQVNSTLEIRDCAGEELFIRFDDLASLRQEYENGLREFA